MTASDTAPEGSSNASLSQRLAGPAPEGDQAKLSLFRALLVLQVIVAGVLGAFPLVLPDTFASLTGGSTDVSLAYRVAGAGTLGYAVMALVGLFRPTWAELRIPVIATFTFNLAAATGALITLGERDGRPIVFVVALAATVFTLIAGYWLYRNEGPDPGEAAGSRGQLEGGFRATIILGTATALVFGVTPLLMARLFAEAFALPANDLFIFRVGGAAVLGYAIAGIFQLLAGRWVPSRIPVVGALAFDALIAVSAAIYLAGGGTSLLGPIVLVVGAFFTFALTGWAARAQR